MEIFDLDGHNLGIVFHYHPIITAYLGIEWRSHGSKGLTFSNDHSKAEIIKRFVQEKTMSTKGIRENLFHFTGAEKKGEMVPGIIPAYGSA